MKNVALSIVVLLSAWTVTPRALGATSKDEQEIRALEDRFVAAVRAKDVDSIMKVVGIRLTQVTATCSMRGWARNILETYRSWRRNSAARRRAGRTWSGCGGRMVSAVRAVVAVGRGLFEKCCWNAPVVAAKLQ
jgi:hypothetical protein